RRHTRFSRDWSSDVCSSDLVPAGTPVGNASYWEKIGDYDSLGQAVASLLVRMSNAEVSLDDLTGELIAQSQEILALQSDLTGLEIGRASCRERVWVQVVG